VGVRRALVIAVLMCVALPLSGCGGGGPLAFGVKQRDLPGLWVAVLPDAPDASIQVSSDGTFSAIDWPENLVCITPHPETVEGLRGQDRVDFSGRWRLMSSQPQVSFSGHGDCRVGWPMNILRVSDKGLAFQIVLDSIEIAGETVRFHKVEPDS
jgi:hypothetical protein